MGVETAAETLADLAGQALERARLYEAEYEVSQRLQRSLLPVLPARLGTVAIGTAYRPAEIGDPAAPCALATDSEGGVRSLTV